MDLGRLLREARLRAGLSQAELARLSATSQATLSAYERGRKAPSAPTLARILAAAGARLTTTEAAQPVVTSSRADLERASRTLGQVLELAAALPSRPSGRLSFPCLPQGFKASR